jgi:hypothetical protein
MLTIIHLPYNISNIIWNDSYDEYLLSLIPQCSYQIEYKGQICNKIDCKEN